MGEETILHNQLDVHYLAEITDSFAVVAISHDHVLAGHILRKLFHGAGIGEDLQAGQLRSGIVPAKLVPCRGIFSLAGVHMHLVLALHIDKAATGHIAGLCLGDIQYTVNGPAIEANDISIQAPCIIEVCPLGKVPASNSLGFYVTRDTIVGKEYILQIQGCSMGGDPIVTAQVKLTAIPDPEYPWETVHSGRYGELNEMGEERTRFCSVELISYTYSEMYILGGAVGNID